jgi:hypothetical protein
MAGGTMKQVKEKLPAILDSVRPGDRVHLIRFDEVAEQAGEFTLHGEEDRMKIRTAIDELKPSGRYTDMKRLLLELKSKVVARQPGSPQYIIVLSDGIDDPRPGKTGRKDRVNLGEYEAKEKLPVQEPYIFYIHLGDAVIAGKEAGLKEDLKDLSSEVRVVRPNRDEKGGDIGLADVQKEIEATRPTEEKAWYLKARDWFLTLPLWAQIGSGLALLLLMLFFIYRISFGGPQRPLEGILSFYEASEHPSMAREIRLNKFRRKDLTIGSGPGAVVRIKEKTFPAVVRLKAKRAGGQFLFRPAKKDLQSMEFLVQKKRGYISSGDRFRITNYTFEYSHGTKK